MNANWIINLDFGWTSPVHKCFKWTSRITINKMVASGLGLESGQKLFCYVAQDQRGRPMLVVYLDGKPRNEVIN